MFARDAKKSTEFEQTICLISTSKAIESDSYGLTPTQMIEPVDDHFVTTETGPFLAQV